MKALLILLGLVIELTARAAPTTWGDNVNSAFIDLLGSNRELSKAAAAGLSKITLSGHFIEEAGNAALITQALSDKRAYVRLATCRFLAGTRYDHTEIKSHARRLALEDKEEGVRIAAFNAAVGSRSAGRAIPRDLLQFAIDVYQDKSDKVSEEAREYLELRISKGSSQDADLLFPLLGSPNPRIRKQTVALLQTALKWRPKFYRVLLDHLPSFTKAETRLLMPLVPKAVVSSEQAARSIIKEASQYKDVPGPVGEFANALVARLSQPSAIVLPKTPTTRRLRGIDALCDKISKLRRQREQVENDEPDPLDD